MKMVARDSRAVAVLPMLFRNYIGEEMLKKIV